MRRVDDGSTHELVWLTLFHGALTPNPLVEGRSGVKANGASVIAPHHDLPHRLFGANVIGPHVVLPIMRQDQWIEIEARREPGRTETTLYASAVGTR